MGNRFVGQAGDETVQNPPFPLRKTVQPLFVTDLRIDDMEMST